MHILKLMPIYFEKIRAGEKIYEIRLNDEKRQVMKIGDKIEFRKEPDHTEICYATIEDLIYFESFHDMLDRLSLDEIGFKGQGKQEAFNLYRKIYSKEKEEKYKVVAIKVKVIN